MIKLVVVDAIHSMNSTDSEPYEESSESETDGGEWVSSTCGMCLHGCGIKVKIEDGVAVKIEGDETNPDNLGKICPKGNSGLSRLYDPDRIKKPLKRTNPEKGLDVDPQWEEISWEEAYDIVEQNLGKIREDDPRKLLPAIGDFQRIEFWAWPTAFGSPNYFSSIGLYCGGSYHPVNGTVDGSFAAVNDYEHCDYWIQLGAGDGFSSHLHVSGSANRMAERRMDGMDLVVADPRCSRGASKADEWLPITPGTDRAFVLGMAHVLVHELERFDREFLRNHTNAPYLVKADGNLLRDDDGEAQVYDTERGEIRRWDEVPSERMAFEGAFEITDEDIQPELSPVANGAGRQETLNSSDEDVVRTGFQIWKEVLEDHTPEEMSDVCDIPAETIRRIAEEFVEAAQIGETIEIDGKEYPYRPAALNYYRGAQAHENGMMDNMTFKMFNMLVGNIDVPGGHMGVPLAENGFHISEGDSGMVQPEPHQLHPAPPFQEEPDSTHLLEWFPIGFDGGHLNTETVMNPEKFGLDYKPEAVFIDHCNPVWDLPNTEEVIEIMEDMEFTVAVEIQHTESTQFADVILPEHTYLESTLINCLEPPVTSGYSVRQPVVEPQGDTRDLYEIMTEIADRLDFLDDWNDALNLSTGLVSEDEYMLDPDTRYSVEEFWDQRAKGIYGEEKGLDWFKENGHAVYERPAEERYMPYGDLRIPFYFNFFQEKGEEIAEKMEDAAYDGEWSTDNYQPVPYWVEPTLWEDEEDGYEYHAISFKNVMHTFGDTTNLPWLTDVDQHDPAHSGVLINSQTAQEHGIEKGDEIQISSKVGSIEGVAQPVEGIHPEVIGISNSISRMHVENDDLEEERQGTHFNKLLYADLEHTDNATAGFETAARVKIEKVT